MIIVSFENLHKIVGLEKPVEVGNPRFVILAIQKSRRGSKNNNLFQRFLAIFPATGTDSLTAFLRHVRDGGNDGFVFLHRPIEEIHKPKKIYFFFLVFLVGRLHVRRRRI